MREFLTVFYGNEIVYAIILASWLFWVALGSFTVSRLTAIVRTPSFILSILFLINALLIPLNVISVRLLRVVLDIPSGQIIALTPIVVSAFVVLMPLTFIFGAIFTSLCLLAHHLKIDEASRSVSTVYLWEGLGAAMGGLVYSFILVHLFEALTIALVLGIITIAVVLLVFKHRHVRLYQCGFISFLILLIVFASGLIERVDDYTRRIQWKGFDLLEVTDSIYGNIAVMTMEDEYSLFTNGILSFSSRDRLTSEENVHYPMLSHNRPRHVLLIGGGVGGALQELLKYKDVTVDYVELDAKVIEVSRRHMPPELLNPLKDPRVHMHYQDARLFVKQNRGARYDVIILNIPDPYTALINRYYTLEFFREAEGILNPNGIVALSVSSSENYLNQEAKRFLRSLHTTLLQVFAEVKSIPGDTHFFLASREQGSIVIDADVFARRLKERGIDTLYVREYYLPFRLSQDRMEFINEVLRAPGRLNSDMRPITYLFDIILFSTHFNTHIVNIYKKVENIRFWHLLVIPAFIFVVCLMRMKFDTMAPIKWSLVTTGFSEIIFQIIVIMAFQSLYGYAYYKVGLILSSFMGGLVLGSLCARGLLSLRSRDKMRIYKFTQMGICLYPLLLPFVFILFRDSMPALHYPGFFASTFAILPVVAGYLGGLQYPLANSLLQQGKEQQGASGSAGFLYALDVLGASLGALLTGTIFIPLLGIDFMAYFCAVVNAVILVVFLIQGTE